MKKKFRLGEIIKKINEEQVKTPEPQHSVDDQIVTDKSAGPEIPSAELNSPSDGLPQQPHIGFSAKKSYTASIKQNSPSVAETTDSLKQLNVKYSRTSISDPPLNVNATLRAVRST